MNSLMTRERDVTRSDVELMQAVRGQDAAAFEQLVRLHGERMLAVARRMMKNEQDAADALQDALISVYRKSASFEGQSQLSTWLHRVTVNACLMRLRASGKRHEANVDEMMPTFDSTGHYARPVSRWEGAPDDAAMTGELRERVRACIDQLPEAYRSVVLLRDIEELDTEETARLLGCSSNCVKTRLHRARCALRELLSPEFAEA